jgi:hypothetical protein
MHSLPPRHRRNPVTNNPDAIKVWETLTDHEATRIHRIDGTAEHAACTRQCVAEADTAIAEARKREWIEIWDADGLTDDDEYPPADEMRLWPIYVSEAMETHPHAR